MGEKFAVIGKGFIYKSHEEAIKMIGGEIVDVADGSEGPDAWKAMVEKTFADCIVILSPNFLHFKMAKFSADVGKTVLCEKPLALKSEEARTLMNYPDVFTVYQLRYHPEVLKLKSEIKPDQRYKIEMDISVHRDEDYWKSWKGAAEKSGGILFNIGIHYFDLLIHIFGEPIEVSTKLLTEKSAGGKISGKNYECDWRISAEAPKDDQKRVFKVNGIDCDFSSKENLHAFVYKDLLVNKGTRPAEAFRSIELIEKIYAKK